MKPSLLIALALLVLAGLAIVLLTSQAADDVTSDFGRIDYAGERQ